MSIPQNQTLELERLGRGADLLPAPLDEHEHDGSEASISAARRYSIPGDVVFSSTQELPDEQRGALRWLHTFAADRNVGLADLGRNLQKEDGSNYSANTLYKILTGRHGADLENVTRAILDFKKFTEETQRSSRRRFHSIRAAREIFERCDLARKYARVSFIYGEPQIGKSTALEEYTRTHNHGETVYVRLPAGCDYSTFMEELAIALRISPQQKTREIRRRVVRCFSPKMLLIIDEAHQLFLNGMQAKSVEFIREIYDRCKMGLVICGTKALADEIQRGRHKALFRQLNLRGIGKGVVLPDRPLKADLNAIAKSYNLAPAAEARALQVESDVIRTDGLGFWCTILEAAESLAHNRKQKMTWLHVIDAHAMLNGPATNLN